MHNFFNIKNNVNVLFDAKLSIYLRILLNRPFYNKHTHTQIDAVQLLNYCKELFQVFI